MALSMQDREHYVFLCGILGNLLSGLVFLAPMPTFYRIYKNKRTENYHSLPYIVALFSSVLWLYYALLVEKDTKLLVTINSVGCGIEIFYIIVFFIYANRTAKILTVKLFLGLNVASLIIIIFTLQWMIHQHSMRVKVLGWICTSISVCVFAAPLSNMAQIVRTKSVEYMSLNLSCALTLSSVAWFFYGFFLKDLHIEIPNVLGFVLGVIQILLYIIYRNGGAKNAEAIDVEERTTETVTVVTPLEIREEEHPVPVNVHQVNNQQEIQELD